MDLFDKISVLGMIGCIVLSSVDGNFMGISGWICALVYFIIAEVK